MIASSISSEVCTIFDCQKILADLVLRQWHRCIESSRHPWPCASLKTRDASFLLNFLEHLQDFHCCLRLILPLNFHLHSLRKTSWGRLRFSYSVFDRDSWIFQLLSQFRVYRISTSLASQMYVEFASTRREWTWLRSQLEIAQVFMLRPNR